MGGLIDFLPLLKGWRYSLMDVDVAMTIPAGETREIQKVINPGWFVSGMAVVNNPNAEFVVEVYYDGLKYEADLSPYDLNLAGLTAPNATGLFCPKYDAALSIYVVVFLPAIYIPFNKKCVLSVRSPAASATNLLDYSSLCYEITDKELFLKSLKEVFGTAGTASKS